MRTVVVLPASSAPTKAEDCTGPDRQRDPVYGLFFAKFLREVLQDDERFQAVKLQKKEISVSSACTNSCNRFPHQSFFIGPRSAPPGNARTICLISPKFRRGRLECCPPRWKNQGRYFVLKGMALPRPVQRLAVTFGESFSINNTGFLSASTRTFRTIVVCLNWMLNTQRMNIWVDGR